MSAADERIQEMIGKKFGRLTVIEQMEDIINVDSKGRTHRRKMVKCLCDCGNETIVRYDVLLGTRHHTRSCGCLQRERASQALKGLNKPVYGDSRERLHNIWYLIIDRCRNPESPCYDRYGGRGIDICDEWADGIDGYFRFKEWALANGYSKDLSVDRINNNSGYSPENCRWATREEQGNNKCNNRMIEHDGKTMTISQWARELGVPMKNLHNRIVNLGWDIDRAFTQPYRKPRTKKESQ